MTESRRLLAEYAEKGCEAAFAELVRRYLDLTYSTAVRLADGDTHLAEDITQTVFIDLARMAHQLSREVMLGGWLHRHACYVASNLLRKERRRVAREKKATDLSDAPQITFISGPEVSAVLDAAIEQLAPEDRSAILQRYFEQRGFQAVGEVLGVSENTARMRVARAVEKLRGILERQGVSSAAAALGAFLGAECITAAPAGLAAAITSAALAAGTATASATTLTILKVMSLTKTQLAVVALALAGLVTVLVQYSTQRELRARNESLQKALARTQSEYEALSNRVARLTRAPAPHRPVPAFQAAATTAPLPQPLSLYTRFKDKQPKLSLEQVAGYLKANNRSATSLLAAYRTTGESGLLEEAMRQFPTDPQVAFEAAFRKDVSADDRRRWLGSMKNSDPSNSLPNYLLALEYFQSGQSDQAVQELVTASAKPQFQDYTLNRLQDDEEAYLGAGYSVAEAKTVPGMQLLLPQLQQMRDLAFSLVDLAKSYRQQGDETSAQATLQMAATLGQRYENKAGETEISTLVGMAVERAALRSMDPNASYGADGRTVQDRLTELTEKNSELQQLNAQLEPLLPNLTDQDWIAYKDRWRVFGEESAIRWVLGKYRAAP